MSSNGGPCGACKFLRRKCVKNCVFAPYFDPHQGTTDFAAVHRVFGASNASKLLLRIPPHRRLDAVVSLCYEALSRVRDPVYGCVANIFTLQQQAINLQAELSYVRARISMLQCLPQQIPLPDILLSPKHVSSSSISLASLESTKFDQTLPVLANYSDDDLLTNRELEKNELEILAQEFLTKYAPQVKD